MISMHSLLGRAVGLLLVTTQPLADVAGAPQEVGPGVGLGEGVGDGLGLGEGEGVGDGLGLGEGVGDGVGVGEGDGLGVGVGVGRGEGGASFRTATWTEAVAREVPARALRLYVVVQSGLICFEPFAGTLPMPLSISIASAPTTSQVRTADDPTRMSPGDATNFCTAKGLVPPVRKSLHAARVMRPDAEATTTANRLRVTSPLQSRIGSQDKRLD
jgi:hypothetical protein